MGYSLIQNKMCIIISHPLIKRRSIIVIDLLELPNMNIVHYKYVSSSQSQKLEGIKIRLQMNVIHEIKSLFVL